jgi:hypothetical protein
VGPITGSAIRVILCMVALRYSTVNRKILTMVRHCFVRCTGCLDDQKIERHGLCPILAICINAASTNCGFTSWAI